MVRVLRIVGEASVKTVAAAARRVPQYDPAAARQRIEAETKERDEESIGQARRAGERVSLSRSVAEALDLD
jgi:hypothetical protein